MRWKWMTIGVAAASLAFAPAAHAEVVLQADPVVITAGPNGPTNNRSPSFEFTATFPTDCRLFTPTAPNPDYAPCVSPHQLTNLADGDYQLVVAPSDTHDPALSAARSFTVDTVAPTVAITSSPPSPTKQTSIPIAFTSPDQGVSFECTHTAPGGSPQTAACTSPWTTDVSGDGDHVFSVVAIDAAGNRSAPDSRTIRLDTVAPTVAITAAPPSPTNATSVTIGFTASESATFTCTVTMPRATGDPHDCASPLTVPTPDEGEYRIEVMATDDAGLSSEPVPVTVVVDRTAPAAVAPSQPDATTFTFAPAESGSSFQCRLEGPSGDTGFAPCTSPKTYPGLAAGDYRFTLRTLDAAGNHSDAAPTTFSVAATAEPTPAPLPEIAPPILVAPPTPTPQANETVVVRASSGTILVRKPGTTEFVQVSRSSGIPLGSEIDARKGRVVLTAETADGKPFERGTFYAGLFVVTQVGGYVQLTLSEELAPCKKRSAAPAKPKSRKLWGDGKGKFRTKGQSSSATVHGTKWLVEDSCDGTFTRVAQGVVSVRDIPRRKTVLLRAGRSYLAKPKK